MPPNLGGFFMVRSYYPSECHADYFDFERIEALKPAIDACGSATRFQSAKRGFHPQVDSCGERLEARRENGLFRLPWTRGKGGDRDPGTLREDGSLLPVAHDVRQERNRSARVDTR